MSDASKPPILPVADSIGEIQVFPRPVVWMAGLFILVLAAFGLYQGVRGAMSSASAAGGQGVLASGDAVSAAAATPISSSGQWSTLSGPAMSSAASAPKAVSAAPPSNARDDDNTVDDSTAPASAAPDSASAPSAAAPDQSAEQPVPMPESAAPPAPAVTP